MARILICESKIRCVHTTTRSQTLPYPGFPRCFVAESGRWPTWSICNSTHPGGLMRKTPIHTAVVAVLAGSAAAVTQFAWSQEGGLEEIIVTAEFREANVQDTPIAITAVNSEMLDARSQTNLAQITAQAPNVSLRPAGSAFGSALVAFIRGIGQTDFNPSVEPGVGIYVDDVYYSTITGNLLDLLGPRPRRGPARPAGNAGRTQRDRRRDQAVHAQARRQGRRQRLDDEGRVQPHGYQGRGRHHARRGQALRAYRGHREGRWTAT